MNVPRKLRLKLLGSALAKAAADRVLTCRLFSDHRLVEDGSVG